MNMAANWSDFINGKHTQKDIKITWIQFF